MFKTISIPFQPEQLIHQLNDREQSPFFTWSNTDQGWKKILAFNPVESIEIFNHNEIEKLFEFVKHHQGHLIGGFINYDLGIKTKAIASTSTDPLSMPLIKFAAYRNFVEFNYHESKVYYQDSEFLKQIYDINERSAFVSQTITRCPFKINLPKKQYEKQFEKIIEYIKSGDIYQINYTHQLTGQSENRGNLLFLDYLKTNPVDFAVFFGCEHYNIISLSPERFISIKDREIATYPIKGTIPRGKTPAEDRINKKRLISSQKEQAELYMITDLLRNDIGEISEIGSVKVVYKKRLQTLAKIFHTYSKVTGQLKRNLTGIEALISMFPGGSITGCPKKRAMEIIDELEDYSRGVYTGSIGYILPNGDLDFNIAIRTIIQKGNQLNLSVGGGITLHSTLDSEFEETLSKAKSFQVSNENSNQ
ncbi:MAG: anthranilate synthase component I family protein [Deltaproteobacteria bacterium]|mgnify:CR=1 FL=1|jgi:para-aminobenzoate synthetase component I|nr:anthranilate synthase component I family protein [Deltaproteobacteria bacterium]MBT4525835.1 anthranilate synthase component I family protein [Deltaproteobacteria bacterium]